MKWAPQTNGYKLTARHEDAVPKRRLVWRWWKCIPLIALGTVFIVFVLATVLQAWLLSILPKDVWLDLYYIMTIWR